MREFAKDNGYVIAIYFKQKDGNYHLLSDLYEYQIPLSTVIIVKEENDYSEVETENKKYLLKLHTNCNIPKIIPIIKRAE